MKSHHALDLATAIVAMCIALLATLRAHATTTNWNTDSNGNFSNSGNWDNGVPDNTKMARFGRGSVNYTVTYNGAAIGFPPPQYQANQIIVSGTNNVTFQRNFLQTIAPALTATNTDTTFANPGLLVGQNSGDNATLNDSVLTSVTDGLIGAAANSTGTLNITGAGMNFNELVVGYHGLGMLNISGSTHVAGTELSMGYFNNIGSHGVVAVSGAGTMFSATTIYVGVACAQNLITISGGAQLNSSSSGYIGHETGASGTVIVDGAGSNWTIGDILVVGNSGNGSLQISDGAQVSDGQGALGETTGSGGIVTVDGAGSKWTSTGQLFVGNGGSATLYVSHGGAVTSSVQAAIADQLTGIATVVIDGTGSTWTQGGDLRIGNGGLNVTGGGSVSTSGNANVGISQLMIASVTVDGSGSTWMVTGGLSLGSSVGMGTITVRNGGLVSTGSPLAIGAHGALKGDGTISGAVTDGGIVAPGATIGALHINGSYTQSSDGALQIEMAGTTPDTQFDRLVVGSAVTLGGTLNVSLINGFIPAGASFDILDWGSLSGVFSSIQLPSLPNGLQWNTSQLYTTGVLSVGIPGDFNGNGIVDAADYVVWRQGLGTIYTQNDYNVWRANFGQTAGSGSAAPENAAVPEPPTALMFILATLVTGSRLYLISQHISESDHSRNASFRRCLLRRSCFGRPYLYQIHG